MKTKSAVQKQQTYDSFSNFMGKNKWSNMAARSSYLQVIAPSRTVSSYSSSTSPISSLWGGRTSNNGRTTSSSFPPITRAGIGSGWSFPSSPTPGAPGIGINRNPVFPSAPVTPVTPVSPGIPLSPSVGLGSPAVLTPYSPQRVHCLKCNQGVTQSNMFDKNPAVMGGCPGGWTPAANYNASTCLPSSNVVYGCTSDSATNYNASANVDDSSCTFPAPTSTEVYGCTDPSADNFNQEATQDNNSCTFSSTYGCTDPNANNYDDTASADNNSCTYDTLYGCADPLASNYDEISYCR